MDGVPPVRGHGADPAADPSGCTLTGPMTPGGSAKNCGGATSRRPWPGGARNAAAGWECTAGWLHRFRRLRVRYERRADIHEAFLSLGCSIICLRRLTSSVRGSKVKVECTF